MSLSFKTLFQPVPPSDWTLDKWKDTDLVSLLLLVYLFLASPRALSLLHALLLLDASLLHAKDAWS